MLKGLKKKLKLRGKRESQQHAVPDCPPDFDEPAISLVRYVEPFTMTSPERVFALRESVNYISKRRIPGDIVECGVWRGGSMMAIAATLIELNDDRRQLYLYDTFEGMTEPTERDRDCFGQSAQPQLDHFRETEGNWCFSPLDEVQQNIRSTGYESSKCHFIKGKVEETIPGTMPQQIALLRLDTDWYESTRHELDHLFPLLSPGGVLIVDDYGHWAGARAAVDEYLEEHQISVLLHRVDYTARMCVKPAA